MPQETKIEKESTELENTVYSLNQNNNDYTNLISRLYVITERLKSTPETKATGDDDKKSKEAYDLIEKLNSNVNKYSTNNIILTSLLTRLESLI